MDKDTKIRMELTRRNRLLRNPVSTIVKPIGQRIYLDTEFQIFYDNLKYLGYPEIGEFKGIVDVIRTIPNFYVDEYVNLHISE